jgi:hypothetical protein
LHKKKSHWIFNEYQKHHDDEKVDDDDGDDDDDAVDCDGIDDADVDFHNRLGNSVNKFTKYRSRQLMIQDFATQRQSRKSQRNMLSHLFSIIVRNVSDTLAWNQRWPTHSHSCSEAICDMASKPIGMSGNETIWEEPCTSRTSARCSEQHKS